MQTTRLGFGRITVCVLGLGAILSTGAGCTAETAAAGENPSETVSATSEAVTPDPMSAHWSQGQTAIQLQLVTDGPCFLTEIEGKFRGAGEVVRTYWDYDQRWPGQLSHAHWFLGGSSSQTGVGGSAMCIHDIAFNDWTWEISNNWAGGPSTTNIGYYDACFLTRVSGEFEGAGEEVSVVNSPTGWTFQGSAYSHGVSAGAICMNHVTMASPSWSPENLAKPTFIAQDAIGNLSCFLQGMTGQFNGAGEMVRTTVTHDITGARTGTVSSKGQAPSVAALGSCIF